MGNNLNLTQKTLQNNRPLFALVQSLKYLFVYKGVFGTIARNSPLLEALTLPPSLPTLAFYFWFLTV